MIKTDYIKVLLEEAEGRNLLRGVIAEKIRRRDEIFDIKRRFLKLNRFDSLNEFGQWFLMRIFNCILEGRELIQIEKEISSFRFYLNRAEGKIPKRTKWEDQFDRAKQVRIEDVIQRYLSVDDFRRNIKCPIHEDKSPSFKVYPKTNSFYCFGCNIRGSPIDLVMQIENCPFKEAVFLLNNF